MSEIADISGDPKIFKISTSILQSYYALNECNGGAKYSFWILWRAMTHPMHAKLKVSLNVLRRLQHANAAVVMSAVKVIMGYIRSKMLQSPAAYRENGAAVGDVAIR